MKWKPIPDPSGQVYAWAADVVGYHVSRAKVRDENLFLAWFNGRPIHDGYCTTPKQAQTICDDHYKNREVAA